MFNIKNCLKDLDKSKQPDSDFRYMALSDLINQLKTDKFKLDATLEKDVVTAILKLLTHNEEVSEVKSFGVKSLAPLLGKIREDKVEYLLVELYKTLTTNKDDQARDIAASGLKSMIIEFPQIHSKHISKIFGNISELLLNTLKAPAPYPDTYPTVLDLMCDILSQYGKNAHVDTRETQKVVIEIFLSSRQSSFIKRAINCLSSISVISDDAVFDILMTEITNTLKVGDTKKVRSSIQLVGNLSRAVGNRMGKYVESVVSSTLKFIKHDDFSEDDELKEISFQTLESLIYRCPTEITPFVNDILTYAFEFIKYDPNYSAGSDEEDMDVEDEYSDEDDDDIGYSDDDDESWKVRKSSSKCLGAIIRTRPELLSELCDDHAKKLVKRFQEREENVRLDVYATFEALLRQIDLLPGNHELRKKISDLSESIFQESNKQLRNKKTKPLGRIGVFQLLSHYIETLQDFTTTLQKYIPMIIPHLSHSFDQKTSTSQLKSETLLFLKKVFRVFNSSSFDQNDIAEIVKQVHRGVKDPHYKIVTESLNVCGNIIKALSQDNDVNSSAMNVERDYQKYIQQLYESIDEKFQSSDADQEVKEAAIYAISLIISRFTSVIPDLDATLRVLSERLKNEITRLYAVRAFEEITSHTTEVDLSNVIEEVLRDLTSFLRQQNRQLKQASLISLVSILKKYGQIKSASMSEIQANIIKELEPLISESELYLSHYVFRLCSVLLRVKKNASAFSKTIFPLILKLLSSFLLQGAALASLLELFATMVGVGSKKLKTDFLLKSLINLVNDEANLSKTSYNCIAQCIAVVVVNDTSVVDSLVSQFSKDIESSESPESKKLLSIHTIGEIGRRLDLSKYKVHELLLASFESPNESIKTSASLALGGVVSFNLSHYLSSILSGMTDQPKKQYLLLGSLREVIVTLSKNQEGVEAVTPFLDSLTKLLFDHASSEEEGTRNIVAECLGKMTIFKHDIIYQLKEQTTSESMYTRSTAVSAVKFSLSDNNNANLEKILDVEMKNFLLLLKDEEIVVRHSSLLAFNYAAHHKPQLIRNLLNDYLPLLYKETIKKPELITTVKLGPFTYEVDNGQPLRQAAYECMYTLLDTCLDRLDLPQFIQHVKTGLSDHYDIKTLNHLILLKLANKAPTSLTASVESLIEPLRATLTVKVKENQAQHEKDRHEDILRSTLRSVRALSNIPSVAENQAFTEFF